jgi:hypothetical protein
MSKQRIGLRHNHSKYHGDTVDKHVVFSLSVYRLIYWPISHMYIITRTKERKREKCIYMIS